MTGQEAREDEREALARLIVERRCVARGIDPARLTKVDIAVHGMPEADAILAAGYRKHPEPEWEYGASIRLAENDAELHILPWEDRAQAARVVDEGNAREAADPPIAVRHVLMKRIAAIPAGPWMPVGDTE